MIGTVVRKVPVAEPITYVTHKDYIPWEKAKPSVVKKSGRVSWFKTLILRWRTRKDRK